jgi:hypothetical protein
MKTLLQIRQLFTILFAAIILFACSKQLDTSSAPQNLKLNATSFVNAGLMHNTNLDLIFKEIKLKKTNGMLKSLGNATFSAGLIDLSKSNTLNLARLTSVDQIENDANTPVYLKRILENNMNAVYQDNPLIQHDNLYTDNVSKQFTAEQLAYINELNVIILDNDNAIQSLQTRITNIETKIYQSSLTQTQQAALYIITNTAKSSLLYWNQNIDAWTGLVNETSLTSTPITHEPVNTFAIKSNNYGFSWKRVARSDVAGAVGGVAAWGVVALSGGPVTLAACGASVGSWAAGCSSYEAIMQLW